MQGRIASAPEAPDPSIDQEPRCIGSSDDGLDLVNYCSSSFMQVYANAHQSEFRRLFSSADFSSLQQVAIYHGSNDGGRFRIKKANMTFSNRDLIE